jgi:hypothetical protein
VSNAGDQEGSVGHGGTRSRGRRVAQAARGHAGDLFFYVCESISYLVYFLLSTVLRYVLHTSEAVYRQRALLPECAVREHGERGGEGGAF